VFEAGAAQFKVNVYHPLESVDGLGAPSRTWKLFRTCWASLENEQQNASESRSAPREANSRSMTLKIRNHMNPVYEIDVRDRVEDARGRWKGDIVAIRYNHNRSIMWCDIETGSAIG
jgi:head-tail adaptor